MSYLVTARRWRPMIFEDVVGQAHVSTTLRNAIATDRLSHAYIFSGPRGVGKTTTARILAKAINCLSPRDANPDNTCELCTEITESRSVNVFEIDGASNRGIDEIRNLRESVRYAPARGKYKVYVIDEVHMLTKEAFNALLKTLEEPPPFVLFIFATTEIQKVPLTILSRCQRFDFRRIGIAEIIDRLRFIAREEKITIDEESLYLIARRSDGSLRDAQSIFDQIIACCGMKISSKEVMSILNMVDEELYFRLMRCIAGHDVAAALKLVDDVVNGGHDLREFTEGVSEHLRHMLVTRTTGSSRLIETSDEYRKRYEEGVDLFSENDLLRFVKIVGETESAMKWSQQPRLKLELGIIKMARMDSSVKIGELLDQIEDLKKKLDGAPEAVPAPRTPRPETREGSSFVRGTVKATPPTLRPDQIVHAFAQASAQTSATGPVMPGLAVKSPGEVPAPLAITISLDEAVAKWPSFVEEACRQKILVGSMLRESHVLGVEQDRLRVNCSDDFHFESLKRNREFLTDLAQQIYGAKLKFESLLQNEAVGGAVPSPPPPDPPAANAPKAETDLRRHPVVQAIMKQFGAVEVP